MPSLIRNGVRLTYREAGSGGPPLLFVHGFGGSAEHFSPQLEYFKRRHRAVALDRRGHGESDKPEAAYTIPEIASEVAWTARELGLHKPVVVVHSMGAIGFELVRQEPGLASALAVLDAPLFPPPPVQQAFAELGSALRTPGYREAIGAVCDQLIFLPSDDAARRSQLHNAMFDTPQSIMSATWDGMLAYDLTPAAASCRIPTLCVASVMPCDEARLRELCPQLTFGRTVGAGHFHQLEVPDQVNAMLERFIALLPAG